MLDPSSSEEDLSDHESARVTSMRASSRRFMENDYVVSHSNNLCSQTCSLDVQSSSTASRSSADNVSLTGTASGGSSNQLTCHPLTGFTGRSSSPSPSLISSDRGDSALTVAYESGADKSEREEEERRRRMLLYVFVMRCIAYPFNARQPTDMVHRQAKVTKQQLQSLKERFQVIHFVTIVLYDNLWKPANR